MDMDLNRVILHKYNQVFAILSLYFRSPIYYYVQYVISC